MKEFNYEDSFTVYQRPNGMQTVPASKGRPPFAIDGQGNKVIADMVSDGGIVVTRWVVTPRVSPATVMQPNTNGTGV